MKVRDRMKALYLNNRQLHYIVAQALAVNGYETGIPLPEMVVRATVQEEQIPDLVSGMAGRGLLVPGEGDTFTLCDALTEDLRILLGSTGAFVISTGETSEEVPPKEVAYLYKRMEEDAWLLLTGDNLRKSSIRLEKTDFDGLKEKLEILFEERTGISIQFTEAPSPDEKTAPAEESWQLQIEPSAGGYQLRTPEVVLPYEEDLLKRWAFYVCGENMED